MIPYAKTHDKLPCIERRSVTSDSNLPTTYEQDVPALLFLSFFSCKLITSFETNLLKRYEIFRCADDECGNRME